VSFSAELWQTITPIYAAILDHPFVRGLTDGTIGDGQGNVVGHHQTVFQRFESQPAGECVRAKGRFAARGAIEPGRDASHGRNPEYDEAE
jgi:hypothetical protein